MSATPDFLNNGTISGMRLHSRARLVMKLTVVKIQINIGNLLLVLCKRIIHARSRPSPMTPKIPITPSHAIFSKILKCSVSGTAKIILSPFDLLKRQKVPMNVKSFV